VSRKLFAIRSFRLQFFDFISSHEQTVNWNWVYFSFFIRSSFNSTFIWISFNRNSVNFEPLQQDVYFRLFSGWWLYIDVLIILSVLLLFIQESFQVLESTAVHEIRKYKFEDWTCVDRLIWVHRYQYKFVGLEAWGWHRATVKRPKLGPQAFSKYCWFNLPGTGWELSRRILNNLGFSLPGTRWELTRCSMCPHDDCYSHLRLRIFLNKTVS